MDELNKNIEKESKLKNLTSLVPSDASVAPEKVNSANITSVGLLYQHFPNWTQQNARLRVILGPSVMAFGSHTFCYCSSLS